MTGRYPYEADEVPGTDGEDAGAGGDARDDAAEDAAGLPAVVRGGWGAEEDATVIDQWPAPGLVPYTRAAPRGWKRWLNGYTAVIAVAAALGGIAGALAVSGMGQAARDPGPGAGEAVEALRTSIGQLASEIKALKDGVGQGSQVTAVGLAAIEQRMAGAEQAQATLSARIADLSKGAPAPGAPVSDEITGSIAPGEYRVVDDWILWRVRNGRALVQGNRGYFEVVQGSALPGLGIVERIVMQDGRWMVFTRSGVIVARG